MDKDKTAIISYIFGLCGSSYSNLHTALNYINEHPTGEYRLFGELGFGGKFWWNHHTSSYYVTMYKEDETKERLELVAKANDILNSL